MDIRAGVIASVILAILIGVLSMRSGIRSIQSARKLTFYRLRRQRNRTGWRLLILGVFTLAFSIWLGRFGEPIAYQYFPPSPTNSLTPSITPIPSITPTPTITLSPTITNTPSVTDTPTSTSTPFVPPAVEALFSGVVTPNPDAVFSPLQFSTVYENYECVVPATLFINPVRSMTACFSYNNMQDGVQWTAIWYRNGILVHFETLPWDGGTGGIGFSEWVPAPEEWLPGTYTVVLFVGLERQTSGQFIVNGDPPTPVPTLSPTITPTPENTPTSTGMPSPTVTP
jgi:type VI secretion system secreted protein VgrG